MMMNLEKKLVSLRKQKGLSQMELAEKLNVSRQAISRWEVGAAVPSTDNLKMLSELYGVSIDYLLSDKPDHDEKVVVEQKEELTEKSRNGNRISFMTYVVAVILAMAVLFSVTVGYSREQKQEEVTPMEEMDYVKDGERSQVTFSLE